jgi:addiction module RelE/StbE family toxin
MKAKVLWTPRAVEDLKALASWISRNNPTNARAFIGRLRARPEALRLHPNLGRVVPELADSSIRELPWEGYRIVYRVVDRQVQVLTVFEGHKQLDGEVGQEDS